MVVEGGRRRWKEDVFVGYQAFSSTFLKIPKEGMVWVMSVPCFAKQAV